VPDQVAAEHAGQHVRFDAFLQPAGHRAQVEVAGLDVPEVPLGVLEALASRHDGGRGQLAGRDEDRALIALYISTGARAAELPGGHCVRPRAGFKVPMRNDVDDPPRRHTRFSPIPGARQTRNGLRESPCDAK